MKPDLSFSFELNPSAPLSDVIVSRSPIVSFSIIGCNMVMQVLEKNMSPKREETHEEEEKCHPGTK